MQHLDKFMIKFNEPAQVYIDDAMSAEAEVPTEEQLLV